MAQSAMLIVGVGAAVGLSFLGGSKSKSRTDGPRLGDSSLSVSTYGADITICYGQNRMNGNMIWTGGIEEVKTTTKTKQKSGKGGGSSHTSTTVTYTYFASFAMATNEGPSEGILKIFLDGKLVMDTTGKGIFAKANHDITYYDGQTLEGGATTSQAQNPSSLIEADKGADTPGFRGVSYCLFDTLPLIDYGNRIPNFNAILGCKRADAFPQTDFDVDAVASTQPDWYILDASSGFAYAFTDLVVGGSGTSITKINYATGVVVYSKLLVESPELGGAAIRVHDGVEGHNFAISPIDGFLYTTRSDSGVYIDKIDPITGEVIESLTYGSVTAPIIALHLFPLQCPTTGGTIECWVASHNSATNRIRFGITGGGEPNGMNVFPVRDGFSSSFPIFYSVVWSWQADASGTQLWGMSTSIATESSMVLQKFSLGLVNDTVGIPSPVSCPPPQAGSGGGGLLNMNIFRHEAFDVTGEGVAHGVETGTSRGNSLLASSGSITTANVPGTTLIDSAATFITDGVNPGMIVENETDGTTNRAYVTSVDSETQITHTAITGGSDNQWELTDTYNVRKIATGGQKAWLGYVQKDNSLLITNNRFGLFSWNVCKFDIETETMIDVRYKYDYEDPDDGGGGTCTSEVCVAAGTAGSDAWAGVLNDWEQRSLWSPNGPLGDPIIAHRSEWFYNVDPVTLDIEVGGVQSDDGFTADPSTGTKKLTLPYRGSAFVNVAEGANSGPSEYFLFRAAGDPEPLDEVVGDMCRRAGLLDHEFDVTELALDNVRGYQLGRQSDVKENLFPLLLGYNVQWVESDWKIKFLKRGGVSSTTVDENDIGADENQSQGEKLTPLRKQEQELTMKMLVRYVDVDRDLQENSQEFKRIREPVAAVGTATQEKIDLPIAFNATEAATLAKRLLLRVWAERTEISTALPVKYLGVDPTDVVTMVADGETYVMNTAAAGVGANGVLAYSGVSDDAAVFDAEGVGATSDFQGQTIPFALSSGIVDLDTPLLRDADDEGLDTYLIYSGATYPQDGFPGSSVWLGPSEELLLPWFSADEVLEGGWSTSTLGDVGLESGTAFGSSQALDTTNTVTVSMVSGTLASATSDEGFLNGNPTTGGVKGMLGGEVIQAKTVVDNGDGSYTLSNLLRGRRGTEWAIHDHSAGERFTVLNEDQPFRVDGFPFDETGLRRYRSVTVGQAWDQTFLQSTFWTGASLLPLSPAQVEGQRDGSDNLIVRWVRRNRTRYEVGWGDGELDEMPLSEAVESYEIDLIEAGTFDPEDPSAWVVSTTKTVTASAGEEVTGTLSFDDQADGTSDITDTLAGIDFSVFQPEAWVVTENFDQDDQNSFFVVDSSAAGTLSIRTPGAPGDDLSNADAVVRQLPTWVQFSAAEIAAAGYNTTEGVFVVVHQISENMGRGYAGYDPLGVDRP